MKGDRKKRKGFFKIGHPLTSPQNNKQTPPEQSLPFLPQTSTQPDRPFTRAHKRTFEEAETSQDDVYLIAHKSSLQYLWNSSIKEHKSCNNDLDMIKYEQWGLSSTWHLSCLSCGYVSKPQKLYREIHQKKPGRKSSSLNMALSTALLCSSIGPSQFTEIMLRIGIDPGSHSGLQANVSKSAKVIRDTALGNMEAERKIFENKCISVQMDTAYNNKIYSSVTPFQAGTQAVTTIIENESGKILHVETASKLCPVGDSKRAKGEVVNCGSKSCHTGCIANLETNASIGNEKVYAEACANVLKKSKVDVNSVTSDGDANIIAGLESVFNHKIEQQRDPRHLTQALIRSMRNSNFSNEMFKDKRQDRRKKRQTRFYTCIAHRTAAEITAALKLTKHMSTTEDSSLKKKEIAKLLKNTPQAIIACFRKNNHFLCTKNSLVCSEKDPWKNIGLHTLDQTGIYMTEGDEKILLDCIKSKRLGQEAIAVTYAGRSTQLAEAKNKSYRAVNPKSVTLPLNWDAKILGRVLFSNIGSYNSTMTLLWRIGHRVAGPIRLKLKKKQYRNQYLMSHKKKIETKLRRIDKRRWNFQIYDEKNEKSGQTYVKECHLIPSTSAN